jgi:hypothetical protein
MQRKHSSLSAPWHYACVCVLRTCCAWCPCPPPPPPPAPPILPSNRLEPSEAGQAPACVALVLVGLGRTSGGPTWPWQGHLRAQAMEGGGGCLATATAMAAAVVLASPRLEHCSLVATFQ